MAAKSILSIPVPTLQITFKSGREVYYAHVPSFVYENEVYGGQIQIWKKGDGNKNKNSKDIENDNERNAFS